jgi:hypothetical protein
MKLVNKYLWGNILLIFYFRVVTENDRRKLMLICVKQSEGHDLIIHSY